jgi:hypothetical protein
MYRALSVRQPWANLIASGEKSIEVRSWQVDFRGPLVICAGATIDDQAAIIHDNITPLGVTICLVELKDIRPLRKDDASAAMFEPGDDIAGLFAWVLSNPRRLASIPVRGQLGLFGVPSDIVVPA